MKFAAEISYSLAKNNLYHAPLFLKIGDSLINKIGSANVLDCCELFHAFSFAYFKDKKNKIFLDVISKRIFLVRKRITNKNKHNLEIACKAFKY